MFRPLLLGVIHPLVLMKVNEKAPSSSYGLPCLQQLPVCLIFYCNAADLGDEWWATQQGFTTLHCYLMDRHFNHIANQSEKNSQWMFKLNYTASTCKFCLEVAGLGDSLCSVLLLCAVRRCFNLNPSSVRIIIMTVLLHMSSHAFGNVTLSATAVARCLHFDYSHA